MKYLKIGHSLTIFLLAACAQSETGEVIKLPPHQPAPSAAVLSQPQSGQAAAPMTADENAVAFDSEGWTSNVGALDSVSPVIPLPRIVKDFCPGEMCGYPHQLVACRDLPLHATDSVGAPVVGHASARDTITVETGNLHIVEPGKIFFNKAYAVTERFDEDGQPIGARRDTSARFAARDTLYLLESEFPGIGIWWYRGKLGRGFPFWDETRPNGRVIERGTGAVQVSRGKSAWWYQVATPSGTKGWWMKDGWEAVGITSLDYKCDFEKGEADRNPAHYRT